MIPAKLKNGHMSRKWQRNKAWEDEHLVGAWTPVRLVLRAFSGVPLAVVLLSFIAVYCALASVPVGLLATVPTWAMVALTAAASALVPGVLAALFVRWVLPRPARAARFAGALLFGALFAAAGAAAWARFAWPTLRYDAATGEGLMFIRSFVAEYQSVTVRRLPGVEMTETQFYAWWPMRLALILFVVNMVVATVRRIEFTYKNLGVLAVHSGIVLIAVGSAYYQAQKQEGDTLLIAPSPDEGQRVGPAQRVFFDREAVVLYAGQPQAWSPSVRLEQRLLDGLPRYNNYGLRAGLPGDAALFSERANHAGHGHAGQPRPGQRLAMTDAGRTLDLPVPGSHPEQQVLHVDPDVRFSVVGYAPYARMQADWVRADAPGQGAAPNPMRVVELFARGVPGMDASDGPIFEFPFFLGEPAQRVRSSEMVAVEFTRGMDERRWADLSATLPVPASHALVIEVPEAGFRSVVPARPGDELSIGETGWTVAVQQLAEEPPFPIITPGYEGATSPVAVLRVTPPAGADGAPAEPVERWVFHRFPELDQDLSTTDDPDLGRPARGKPDPRIRIAYLDFSRLQVYLDERPDTGAVRAIVRQPQGQVRVHERADDGWIRDLVPNPDGASVDLRLGERWAHARRVERPVPVPVAERDNSMMGTHDEAFVAVRVWSESLGGPDAWSETVWLPFTKYVGVQTDTERRVVLPDGREVRLVFGRQQRPFPDFTVSMIDFQMIAYDHRGAPRDYQSTVRVAPASTGDGRGFEPYEHVIKLNEPLRAPFHWDPDAGPLVNLARRLRAGLDPNQFKLSQAGWDRLGWQETQAAADRGELPGPRVSFTILGVGNNPGIHVIAFGGVLMGVGIPWAFYLKPWLVRREKERLARAVREGRIKTPQQRRAENAAEVPA